MSTRPGVVRLAVVLLPVAVAVAATIAGCGPSATATPASAVASESAPPQPGLVTAEPSLPPGTTPAATGSTGAGVIVDAGLLRVLPATIDGVPLEPDPTTAEQISSDPTVAESAQAIAVALAIRPGTSTGDDLAIVSVVRLRPGVFTEAWFADWRTTYDQGACDVAGGIAAEPSQTSIGGRTVHVGTCAGDAQTYHVHLAGPGLIVSITAAGAGHFGELVMAGLAE